MSTKKNSQAVNPIAEEAKEANEALFSPAGDLGDDDYGVERPAEAEFGPSNDDDKEVRITSDGLMIVAGINDKETLANSWMDPRKPIHLTIEKYRAYNSAIAFGSLPGTKHGKTSTKDSCEIVARVTGPAHVGESDTLFLVEANIKKDASYPGNPPSYITVENLTPTACAEDVFTCGSTIRFYIDVTNSYGYVCSIENDNFEIVFEELADKCRAFAGIDQTRYVSEDCYDPVED